MVSNIFYFHPYLGKWSNLTNILSDGLKPPTRLWFRRWFISFQNGPFFQVTFPHFQGELGGFNGKAKVAGTEDTLCKTFMGKSQEKRNRKGRIQLLLSPVGEFSKTCLLFVCLFVCLFVLVCLPWDSHVYCIIICHRIYVSYYLYVPRDQRNVGT